MAETLDQILRAMLAGEKTYQELTGGLRLQMRRPTEALDLWRLACYRVENRPSDRELATVRRILEPLLPAGTQLVLGPAQEWHGQDGRMRTGRPFSWREPAAVQTGLFPEAGA